jgi:hypothetical protein
MLDVQTGLYLLRSSCSNAAAIEEFSILICNFRPDTPMVIYCVPIYAL